MSRSRSSDNWGWHCSHPGDVLDQHGPRAGAVALPQLSTRDPVIGAEIQRPFTFVRPAGLALLDPGRMSLTNTVPALVPSLFQSSLPFCASVAVKKTVPPTSTKLVGMNSR